MFALLGQTHRLLPSVYRLCPNEAIIRLVCHYERAEVPSPTEATFDHLSLRSGKESFRQVLSKYPSVSILPLVSSRVVQVKYPVVLFKYPPVQVSSVLSVVVSQLCIVK